LASCPACQRRAKEVRELAQASALAPAEPAGVLVAEIPAAFAGGTKQKASRSRQLFFPSDPHLSARICCDRAGVPLLEVAHGAWPSATLVRLAIADAAKPRWVWLTPLRAEKGRVATRIGLQEETLAGVQRAFLHIQRIAATELTDDDLPLLREV